MFQMIVCALVLLALATCGWGITKIKGEGAVTEVEKALSAFEKIDNRVSADLRFHKSDEFRAIVKTHQNIHEYVELNQDGDTLIVQMMSNLSYDYKKLEIDIYCPTLSEVSIYGAGDFTAVDDIEIESFTANIVGAGDMRGNILSTNYNAKLTGAGDISGKVICQNFTATINGAGDIDLVGSAQTTVISINGAGDFKGKGFVAKELEASIYGAGDIVISVEDSINASVYGAGDIRYYGNPPQVRQRIFGAGDIKKG